MHLAEIAGQDTALGPDFADFVHHLLDRDGMPGRGKAGVNILHVGPLIRPPDLLFDGSHTEVEIHMGDDDFLYPGFLCLQD